MPESLLGNGHIKYRLMKSLNFNLKCRSIFLMVLGMLCFSVTGIAGEGTAKPTNGESVVVWNGGNHSVTTAVSKNSVTFTVVGPSWDGTSEMYIGVVLSGSGNVENPNEYVLGSFSVGATSVAQKYVPYLNTAEYGYNGTQNCLSIMCPNKVESKFTVQVVNGVVYVCDGDSPCVSTDPFIEDGYIPTVTASATTLCGGGDVKLEMNTVPADKYNAAKGYPTYQWYRGSTSVLSAHSKSYTTNLAGTYYCKFCVADGVCVNSESVEVTSPGSPKVVLDKSSLSFSSYVGDTPSAQGVTATVSGVCADVLSTASFVDGEDNFTLTDNGDGTFTIAPNYSTSSTGSYSGHVKFKIDGGENAILTLDGSVYEPLTAEFGNCAPIGSTSSANSVVTTGGAVPLSYQWYKANGSKISGETSASCSSSEAAYCIVSDATGNSITVNVKKDNVTLKVADQSVALSPCGVSKYVATSIIDGHGQAKFELKLNGSNPNFTKKNAGPGTWSGDYYQNYLNESGTNYSYYFIIDVDKKEIEATTTAPNCNTEVLEPKLIPSQKAFCSPTDVITLDASTTAENNIITNPASCYPQYVFKRGSEIVQSGSTPTLDITVAESGTYTCDIYASSTSFKTTDPITLSAPSPSISVTNGKTSDELTSVILESQLGESIPSKTVTVEVNGTCDDDDVVVTTTGDFEVTKTGVNEYTIKGTYSKGEKTIDPHAGSVVFSSTGASPVTVDLKGYVFPCSSGEVANFNFEDGSLPTIISTGLKSFDGSDKNNGYSITSKKVFDNGDNLVGTAGKVLLTASSQNKYTALTLNTTSLEGAGFLFAMDCGNTSYSGKVYVKVGEETWTIEKNKKERMSFFVPASSSVDVTVENNNNLSVYFDNISVTKLCPPTVSVSISSGSACDGTSVFSATPEGAMPFEYEWYVDGALAKSRSEESTYTNPESLPDGTQVHVKVWDSYGLVAESEDFIVQCMNVKPSFTNNNVCIGGETALRITDTEKATIAAAGMPQPLSYQWYFNGSPKGGASTSYSDLNFASVSSSDAGTYTLYIIDAKGKRYATGSAELTVKMPKFTVDKSSLTLSEGNSYSGTIEVTPADVSCFQTASAEFVGGDAGKLEVTNTGNTYTVALNAASQSVAGVYESTLVLYDRVKSETEKDVAVSATVPLTLSPITSARPCVAAVGFSATVPATKTNATCVWKVNGTIAKTETITASSSETSIIFNPSKNPEVGDVISLEVTTADGLTETKKFTVESCGLTMTIAPTSFEQAKSYVVCPGQEFSVDFDLKFVGGVVPDGTEYTYSITSTSPVTLADAGGSKTGTVTFPTTPGDYTYTVTVDFTVDGESYTNSVSFFVTVLDDISLNIEDVNGCRQENIVFYENTGADNIYWYTESDAYDLFGPESGKIDVGKSFFSGATVEGKKYYFVVKSDLGSFFCKESNAKALLNDDDLIYIYSQYSQPVSVCQGSIAGDSPNVSKAINCSGTTLSSASLSYQWYKNDIRSISGAIEVDGATNFELDVEKINTGNVGTYYYFCKVTYHEYSTYSDFTTITVTPSPDPIVIRDTAVYNGKYFIVPVDNVQISTDMSSWKDRKKGDEIQVWGSPKENQFYVRAKPDATGCASEPTTFYVWAGQGGVGYISATSDFGDQTKCMNEKADTWHVQGASPWGLNNLTYRWYLAKGPGETSGGTLVSSEQSFTPPTNKAGVFYYYCIVGYTGQTSTYVLGTYSLTVPGFNDFIIEDVAVCANSQSIDFAYANDTYAVSYGLNAAALDNSRAQGSTANMNMGTSGTAPFLVNSTTPVYFSVTDENGCKVTTKANVVVYDNSVSITDESDMKDFAVCQTAEVPTLAIDAILCGSDGDVSYQWYKASGETTEGVAIPGATTNTYTPSTTDDLNTNWYYCVASYGTYSAPSKRAKGTIYPTQDPELTASIPLTDGVLDMYCTESVSFTGNKNNFTGFVWTWETVDPETNEVTVVGSNTTVVNGMTYSPSCDDATQPTQFHLRVIDKNGCPAEAIIPMNIHPLGKTYYYCGPTAVEYRGQDLSAPWGLNDLNNWHTNSNCTGDIPTSFTAPASKFIVDKPGVELLAEQTWEVGGDGTRVEVGTGKWNKMSESVAGANASNQCYTGVYCGRCEYFSTLGSNKVDEAFGTIGSTDFRRDASSLKISGTMKCTGKSEIDVKGGGALEIATDLGTPKIGSTEEDIHYQYDPDKSTSYNVLVVPGGSVTYSGKGVTKIQEGTYSQLYINQSDPSVNVVFPEGTVEIKQLLKYDTEINNSKIDVPESSIVTYTGRLQQEIAPMAYSNLTLENTSRKFMIGDVTVNGTMYVGPSTTLVGGDEANVLTLTKGGVGADKPLDYRGAKIEPGNLTVEYTSSAKTEVAAINYYNLALTDVNITKTGTTEKTITKIENVSAGGERVFPPVTGGGKAIGIAGTIVPDPSAKVTVTGSEVIFNGSTHQEMPAFTFDKLTIDNSSVKNNTTSNMDNKNCVSIAGDVVVLSQLTMKQGILNTADYVVDKINYEPKYHLSVKNSSVTSISDGHFNSTKDASFIVGPVTKNVVAGSSTNKTEIPVGNFSNWYMPITMSSISNDGTVTVSAESGTTGSNLKEPLETIDHDKYWHVSGTYGKASFGLESRYDLQGSNCIAIASGLSEQFVTLNGTVDGKGISDSKLPETALSDAYLTMGKQVVVRKKYYYDCSGNKDITDITSWYTASNGAGTQAISFSEDYATWIVECNATIATKPLEITGSDVVVELNDGVKLTAYNTFKTSALKQGKSSQLYIGKKTECTVYGSHEIADKAVINNYGVLNTYSKTLAVNNGATVTNFAGAQWNMYNVSLKLAASSQSTNENVGHIINYGAVNMTNSSLSVEGRFTQLKNATGAIWSIDNTMAANNKSVVFDKAEFRTERTDYQYVSLECGSTFYVKHSDLTFWYGGMEDDNAYINGDLIVEDGNMLVRRQSQGGGKYNITGGGCGNIYLTDTDKSGDGLLTIQGSGGSEFNVNGTVYAMGVVTEGGSGDKINVNEGGFMFIGNMGATLPQYSWVFTIDVKNGGTLNYCGNRTALGDNIGTNGGTLNYAESFYGAGLDNPVNQGDFTANGGNIYALYEDNDACMADYIARTKAEISSLLPVEFTMLYGVCKDELVELHWQTASETNNEYFTILRSFDGIAFEEIDYVWGAGTTTAIHNYVFYDTDDKEGGIVYYKLRQTDYDGNVTETKVIAVQTCGKNAQFWVKKDEVEVMFNNPESSNHVVITTLTGKIVYSKTFKDVESARIALPQANGIYIISVIDRRQITSEKIVKY